MRLGLRERRAVKKVIGIVGLMALIAGTFLPSTTFARKFKRGCTAEIKINGVLIVRFRAYGTARLKKSARINAKRTAKICAREHLKQSRLGSGGSPPHCWKSHGVLNYPRYFNLVREARLKMCRGGRRGVWSGIFTLRTSGKPGCRDFYNLTKRERFDCAGARF